MRRWVALISIFSVTLAHAQNDSTFFFKLIKGDSVKLFFNEACEVTEEHCALFFRYTRVDEAGNFHGYFKDVSSDGKLIAKGRYIHGVKDGLFEEFYTNGKVMMQGNYSNNLPTGRWNLFYENGLPHRTVIISDGDTLLWTQIDPNGYVNVTGGEGTYITYKAFQSRFYCFLHVKGEIRKGKPHGMWTTPYQGGFAKGQVFTHKEYFDNGKMLRTTYPDTSAAPRPRLTQFIPGSYLALVEKFEARKCLDTIQNVMDFKYNFRDKMRMAIHKVMRNRESAGNFDEYKTGVNTCLIEFRIDENGTPGNFKLLSNFGNDFLLPLSEVVTERTSFQTKNATVYMYLNLFIQTPKRDHDLEDDYYIRDLGFLSNKRSAEALIEIPHLQTN